MILVAEYPGFPRVLLGASQPSRICIIKSDRAVSSGAHSEGGHAGNTVEYGIAR